MDKKFKLQASDMVQLTELSGYAFATDDITVKGMAVGYMYREETPDSKDSGWRYFSGHQTEKEANDPNYVGLYSLNTIANYDRTILPFLNSGYGKAFGKDSEGNFQEESFFPELA